MKRRVFYVLLLSAVTFCLIYLPGAAGIDRDWSAPVAAADPQIALEISEIGSYSVKVAGTVTNLESVDGSGFEYRLVSGDEILWISKEASAPSLDFTVTIEDLQSGCTYAVRAYYTLGLAIYYSDVQEFDTPDAPTETTTTAAAETTTTAAAETTTTAAAETTTTTAAETTTTTAAETTTTAAAPTAINNSGTDPILLIFLGVIALAFASIAVTLIIIAIRKNKAKG